MNRLHEIDAEKLEQAGHGQGFIAALDQSGGSTPKALKGYGIEEDVYTVNGVRDEAKMFDLVHEMRTRVIKSPEFNGQKIMGAILFEMTMDRTMTDSEPPNISGRRSMSSPSSSVIRVLLMKSMVSA